MTIGDTMSLKAVQELNMPDACVALNVYYWIADFQESQEDSDVLDAMEEKMEDLYGELTAEIVADVTLGTMYGYYWTYPAEEWVLIGSREPSVTFNSVDSMLPHGVAALVSKNTTRPKTVARKYLPGFSEGTQTDGEWDAGVLTNLAAYAVAWRGIKNISAGNDLNPGAFSTITLTVEEFLLAAVVRAIPAYQRRRTPGVGS